MRQPVRCLTQNATRPISVIPNAGLPLNTGVGDAVYPLEPGPMAQMLGEFVEELGVRIVGGCCGTTPAHLEAVVSAVRGARAAVRGVELAVVPGAVRGSKEPRAASAMRAASLRQDPAPLLVGERGNAQGS